MLQCHASGLWGSKCGIARAKLFLLSSLPLKYFDFLFDKASGKDHELLESSCVPDESVFCFMFPFGLNFPGQNCQPTLFCLP